MNKKQFADKIKDRYRKNIYFTDEEFEMFCKLSQTNKVWWHLKNIGTITTKDAHEIYGMRYCTSAIKAIRKDPFTYGDKHFYIDSVPTNDDGEVDRFGKKSQHFIYTLKQYT